MRTGPGDLSAIVGLGINEKILSPFVLFSRTVVHPHVAKVEDAVDPRRQLNG